MVRFWKSRYQQKKLIILQSFRILESILKESLVESVNSDFTINYTNFPSASCQWLLLFFNINNSVVSNWIQLNFQSIEICILLNEVYVLYHLVHFFYKNQEILLQPGVFLFFWHFELFCSYFLPQFSDFPKPQSPSIVYFTKALNSILQKGVGQSFETFATVLAVFFHQKPTFKVFAHVKKLFLIISVSALFLFYSNFLPNFSLIVLMNLFLQKSVLFSLLKMFICQFYSY